MQPPLGRPSVPPFFEGSIQPPASPQAPENPAERPQLGNARCAAAQLRPSTPSPPEPHQGSADTQHPPVAKPPGWVAKVCPIAVDWARCAIHTRMWASRQTAGHMIGEALTGGRDVTSLDTQGATARRHARRRSSPWTSPPAGCSHLPSSVVVRRLPELPVASLPPRLPVRPSARLRRPSRRRLKPCPMAQSSCSRAQLASAPKGEPSAHRRPLLHRRSHVPPYVPSLASHPCPSATGVAPSARVGAGGGLLLLPRVGLHPSVHPMPRRPSSQRFSSSS